jgi:hypothetical protein
VQTAAAGWWLRRSAWHPVVQVARSDFGGACELWQLLQLAVCEGTAWSAGSFARSWQVVHVGGAAIPFGP